MTPRLLSAYATTKSVRAMKSFGTYGALGIELLLSMGVGYYGGGWIDRKAGTHVFAAIGFLLGGYAGFRALFRAAKRMERDIDREDRLARARDPWAKRPEGDDEPKA